MIKMNKYRAWNYIVFAMDKFEKCIVYIYLKFMKTITANTRAIKLIEQPT